MGGFLFKKGPGKAAEPITAQSIDGGENDEVQEHTNGINAGNIETNTSSS